MAVILASKLSFIDIIHCFRDNFVYHLYRNTIRRLLEPNHHCRYNKVVIKIYLFRKFVVFDGKNACDSEDKTYYNCYVLKYSQIDFPDNLNPLKHICITTNCTTFGTFTLIAHQNRRKCIACEEKCLQKQLKHVTCL